MYRKGNNMNINTKLNCGEFKDYIVDRHPRYDGVQYIFRFPNDYGASVVKCVGSYGGCRDYWELCVIIFDNNGRYYLTYNTEITDDVLGWLTDAEVVEVLRKIQALE